MITIIQGGDVLSPDPLGPITVGLAAEKIIYLGGLEEARFVDLFGEEEVEVVRAHGNFVCPGIIDCHIHLIGGSGEDGFSTKSPEISLSELVLAGITTAVGTLGADTTTRTMAALIAKVKGLREECFSAYCYTGGYPIPPATLTGSVKSDILFVEEVIGLGELALADRRSSAYDIFQISPLVHDAFVAGTLSRKAGITHFHMGEGKSGLSLVRKLLDEHDVPARCVHPTHVTRTPALLAEAAEISRKGVTVDFDTVDPGDLLPSLKKFIELGGSMDHLTFSSDADPTSPSSLIIEMRNAVQQGNFTWPALLKHVTSVPARILRLRDKGRIAKGYDADILILDQKTLEVRDVFTKGRHVVKNGKLNITPRFLLKSERKGEWCGQKSR